MKQALSKVPEELKSLPYWLTWHYEPGATGKKPTKKPNVPSGKWDGKPFQTFPAVLREYERCQLPDNQSRADGIGFAILSTHDIVGIDIDDVSDEDIKQDAVILSLLQAGKTSYIERSVSRKGFHIVGTCSNKQLLLALFRQYNNGAGAKSPDGKIEMYAGKHYFTVSGYALYSGWGNIDNAIMIAWEQITGKPLFACVTASSPVTPNNAHTTTVTGQTTKTITPTAETPYRSNPDAGFSDEDVLSLPKLALETTIKKMYAANPVLQRVLAEGYATAPTDWFIKSENADESRSGVDMKVAGILAYWLKRYGTTAIVAIMERSALYRPDRKGKDYLTNTVQTAVDSAEKFFPAVNYQKLSPTEKEKLSEWLDSKKEGKA